MNRWFILPVMAFLAVGCQKVPDLPPISDSGQSLPGKFIWRDLITPDPEAAERFYHDLLGWDFEALGDSGYSLIRQEGDLIGGMVDANKVGEPVKSALWLNAISVTDIKASVRAVVDAGGKVLHKPRLLKSRGKVAVVMDQDGAVLQLIQAVHGDPVDVDQVLNRFLWTELIANDFDGAIEFYHKAFGYDVVSTELADKSSYRLLKREGKPRGGIIANPFDDTRSAWIPYVRVDNAQLMAKKASKLGARIVVEPNDTSRKGTLALILDPTGAPLALQKWSPGEWEGQ